MKNLKNFINESQTVNESKYNMVTSRDFKVKTTVQPGFDPMSNQFGVILCQPLTYDEMRVDEREIVRHAKTMGFKVNQKFADYAEGAGITSMDDNEYILFAPANEVDAYWTYIGFDYDGVEIVERI